MDYGRGIPWPRLPQPLPERQPHASGTPRPNMLFRAAAVDTAFSDSAPLDAEIQEKFAGAAVRLQPGISLASPGPHPSASPWRLLEVGGGKQTRRKAKYYECFGRVTSGGGGPAGQERDAEADNKGSDVWSREQLARGRGCSDCCVSAGSSGFSEGPRSLISLQQLHLFTARLPALALTPRPRLPSQPPSLSPG